MITALLGPVISEKSFALAQQGVFSFWVTPDTNKHQIAEAVSLAFDVEVIDVRTIAVQSKTKRTGKKRITSSTGGRRKKALVSLKKGQTIKLFETDIPEEEK